MTTSAKIPLLNLHTIRVKLAAMFLVFGLLPASGIFAVFIVSEGTFEVAFREPVKQTAVAIGDVIDRNLFERYGDVQAFGLNAAALDPMNWKRPGDANPLVRAMNGYMTGYGIYRLMVLVDTTGTVLAVNSVDPTGQALDTSSVYRQNFADASWLRSALAGDFLVGGNGLSGTVVEQANRNLEVAGLYGDDGYVLTFAAPVKDAGGRTVGVWVNFADFGLVEDIVATFHAGLSAQDKARAEITILDPQGRVIVDFDPMGQGWTTYKRNPDVIGKRNLAEKGVSAAVAAVAGEVGSSDAMHARKQILQAAGYTHTQGAYDYPGLDWSVLVRMPAEEAYASIGTVQTFMVTGILVSLALILAIGLFAGRLAARPITNMTEAMRRPAAGDHSVEVPAADRKDEIGAMATTVQVFKENAIEKVRLEAEQVENEKRAAAEKTRAMNELADNFEASVKGVVDTVASASTEMQATAQSMSATAEETNQQAAAVATASEQASNNVQTVASAAEELSASISEISGQVQQSSQIANGAAEQAQKTTDQVSSLVEAANRIGEVVKLISDIAEQTNLLALNATIEAARAGEAGKGFAVVASEVKSLATQTAKATEEISSQIGGIQSATTESAKAITEIATTIGEINQIAGGVAAAVEEQGAATQEISRNVQEAATGTQEVNSNIAGVTQAASETGTSASQVLDAAGELSQQSEVLRNEVDTFIAKVRAA